MGPNNVFTNVGYPLVFGSTDYFCNTHWFGYLKKFKIKKPLILSFYNQRTIGFSYSKIFILKN